MKILNIIASINPKGGGPMEGVRQVGMKKIEMVVGFLRTDGVLMRADPCTRS